MVISPSFDRIEAVLSAAGIVLRMEEHSSKTIRLSNG
jgi:hypothetical protein